mgnify:CR=1 FL=1
MLLKVTKGVYDRANYQTYDPITVEQWVKLIGNTLTYNTTPIQKLDGYCFGAMILPHDTKLTKENITGMSAAIFDFDSCGVFKTPGAFLHYIEASIQGLMVIWWETYNSHKPYGDGTYSPIRMRLLIPYDAPLPLMDHDRAWIAIADRFEVIGITISDRTKQVSGGPDDPSMLYLDATSKEPPRLHVAPGWGGQWGIIAGMPLAPGTASLKGTAQVTVNGQDTMNGVDTDQAIGQVIDFPISEPATKSRPASTTHIIHESGSSIPITDITQSLIRKLSRAGEDKLRCRCPKSTGHSTSISAFAHIHHGIIYITCTSANHNHVPGYTWPILGQGFSYQVPKPYGVSPMGALLRGRVTGTKTKKIAYETISFTTPIISSIYVDGETADEWWGISWNDVGSSPPKHSVTLRRDDIGTANKLSEKAGRLGLDVNESNKRELTRYLSEALNENHKGIPKRIMASRLGWFKEQDKEQGSDNLTGFMLGNTWMASNIASSPRELIIPHGDGRADMVRGIRQHGKLESWFRGYNLLSAYPFPCCAIYQSIASVILQRIGALPSVLEFGGSTGTGKTVSLKISASVWGQPDDMISGWDGTAVDLERITSFLNAMPMFKDDTKTMGKAKNSIDPEWAVYRIVSGEGRGRATPQGVEQRRKWGLNLLMTGEEPIYASGQSGGARARILSIQDPPFMAQTKDRVSSIVAPMMDLFLNNYGIVGPLIVSELLRFPDQKLMDYHSKQRVYWQERLSAHSASDRIASHLALLDLAARFLARIHSFSLGLRENPGNEQNESDIRTKSMWHISHLATHLIEIDKASGVVDPIERSFKDFYSWALSHRGDFWSVGHGNKQSSDINRTPHSGWLGRWDHNERWTEIYFNRNALARFLKELGYSEAPNTLATHWGKRGWLNNGKDRLQHSVRIAGGNDWCYKVERAMIERELR